MDTRRKDRPGISDSEPTTSSWHTGWAYVKRYWTWPVLLVVGVYVCQQYMPNIDLTDEGRRAPTFAAETLDGSTFRLRDHRGDVIVVNVWATWCPPCRVEMPGFVDLQEDFRDDGVRFVRISVDRGGTKVVRPFVEGKGVNFPQIVDPSLAARHFPGDTVPRTYLIDKQGRIRYEHSGIILKWALDDALETLTEEPAPAGARRASTSAVNRPLWIGAR